MNIKNQEFCGTRSSSLWYNSVQRHTGRESPNEKLLSRKWCHHYNNNNNNNNNNNSNIFRHVKDPWSLTNETASHLGIPPTAKTFRLFSALTFQGKKMTGESTTTMILILQSSGSQPFFTTKPLKLWKDLNGPLKYLNELSAYLKQVMKIWICDLCGIEPTLHFRAKVQTCISHAARQYCLCGLR